MPKRVIVATTIQHPTRAIEQFDRLADWTLIVVGDLKTPKRYKLKRGLYLSPAEQEGLDPKLSDAIGWNTHARRNFGHLLAARMGADIVAVVDDDNVPLAHWGKALLLGRQVRVNYYDIAADAFDPVGATNYPYLWHRGFPVQLVGARKYPKPESRVMTSDIQADFWNGDPDIDAMARILYRPRCSFSRAFFPLASNKPSPFNSQNTFLTRQVLPYCFFLPHVSPLGRQSDIWMSYHLFSLGFKTIYGKPSVCQQRNMHDPVVDLRDELIGYEKNAAIVAAINDGSYRKENFWPERTCRAYALYRKWFIKNSSPGA